MFAQKMKTYFHLAVLLGSVIFLSKLQAETHLKAPSVSTGRFLAK